MSEPYTAPFITKILRWMPEVQLAAVTPHQFQMWPAQKITPAETIRELIQNEISRRRRQRDG